MRLSIICQKIVKILSYTGSRNGISKHKGFCSASKLSSRYRTIMRSSKSVCHPTIAASEPNLSFLLRSCNTLRHLYVCPALVAVLCAWPLHAKSKQAEDYGGGLSVSVPATQQELLQAVQDVVAENMEILNSPRIPVASVNMTRQLKQEDATAVKAPAAAPAAPAKGAPAAAKTAAPAAPKK